jgi:hypothetical protein
MVIWAHRYAVQTLESEPEGDLVRNRLFEMWISEPEIPGCQGRFLAFDLPTWQRLPDRDLAPTGYRAALSCAELFLAGHRAGARAALEEAVSLDGATAPGLLMQTVLQGLDGDETGAAETLQQVAVRWEGTPAGTLAHAWLAGTSSPPIPFPSAIRALVHLQPGGTWAERAVPAVI